MILFGTRCGDWWPAWNPLWDGSSRLSRTSKNCKDSESNRFIHRQAGSERQQGRKACDWRLCVCQQDRLNHGKLHKIFSQRQNEEGKRSDLTAAAHYDALKCIFWIMTLRNCKIWHLFQFFQDREAKLKSWTLSEHSVIDSEHLDLILINGDKYCVKSYT